MTTYQISQKTNIVHFIDCLKSASFSKVWGILFFMFIGGDLLGQISISSVGTTYTESFNGLPGMILGLAIPRLSETIYATKLELVTTQITVPAQGKSKIVKRSQIDADLKKGLAQWGKFGKVIAWAASL